MSMVKEYFKNYLKNRGYLWTTQRECILNIFLKAEDHLTVEELYNKISSNYPDIGRSTVYRTLKHLVDSGLAREVPLEGGTVYEQNFQRGHHDHIICIKCGSVVEFFDETIEKLQNKIAKKYKHKLHSHRMLIYGICPECQKKG